MRFHELNHIMRNHHDPAHGFPEAITLPAAIWDQILEEVMGMDSWGGHEIQLGNNTITYQNISIDRGNDNRLMVQCKYCGVNEIGKA